VLFGVFVSVGNGIYKGVQVFIFLVMVACYCNPTGKNRPHLEIVVVVLVVEL
jgi:hypothetical protein